jgi:DNA-binding IclR family transcriptional regulator
MSDTQSGIKSVEVGGRLLEALVRSSVPLTLSDLAANARLSPSAAHRYLTSYKRLGLVSQDTESKKYDIGPFGVQLGVAALGRWSFLSAARGLQCAVRDELDESVVLAVWGEYGPVIIAVEESRKPIVLTMRVGATLPLFRTAIGWVFAANMPKSVLKPIIKHEKAEGRGPIGIDSVRGTAQKLKLIREKRFAAHSGHLLHAVSGIAVPLWDASGAFVAVLSVFASADRLDTSDVGEPAKALKAAAQKFCGQ